MFGHLPELAIILVIGLIVFGPEKLPEVAAEAGKMVRQVREMMDDAINPQDTHVPEDFSTYYYESLAHSGEDIPAAEADPEFDLDMVEVGDDAAEPEVPPDGRIAE